ncbi:MAG TPA: hypothetical protein VHJ17_26485 [Thermomonospora sp.]|nr:hypothetical protein [Thermomonospora sp.]
MDVRDPALRAELDRRLGVLEREEAGDAAHAALGARDLWAMALLVAALVVVGWVIA